MGHADHCPVLAHLSTFGVPHSLIISLNSRNWPTRHLAVKTSGSIKARSSRNLVSFANLLESVFDQRLAARVMCVKEGAYGLHLGSAQVVQSWPWFFRVIWQTDFQWNISA
jgi:hypothetical protein